MAPAAAQPRGGFTGAAYEPVATDLAFFLDLSARIVGATDAPSCLYARYRQRSLWDLDAGREPFRVENRFTPELGGIAGGDIGRKLWPTWPDWLGVTGGYIHESNGAQGDDSRGWNRVFAGACVGRPDADWQVTAVLWHGFRVEPSTTALRHHAGDGEFSVDWIARRHPATGEVALRLRGVVAIAVSEGAPRPVPHGQFELAWRPAWLPAWLLPSAGDSHPTVLAQWYVGTGEYLHDYRDETSAVRLGLALR